MPRAEGTTCSPAHRRGPARRPSAFNSGGLSCPKVPLNPHICRTPSTCECHSQVSLRHWTGHGIPGTRAHGTQRSREPTSAQGLDAPARPPEAEASGVTASPWSLVKNPFLCYGLRLPTAHPCCSPLANTGGGAAVCQRPTSLPEPALTSQGRLLLASSSLPPTPWAKGRRSGSC